MKRIISLTAVLALLAGAGFGAYVWHWEDRPHVLEIYCFALDKSGNSPGNLAVFIRTPDGHTVLIDGGKSSSITAALGSVMPFYRRSIDAVISTNPDDSHVTGLVAVANRYRVGKIVQAYEALSATSSAYMALAGEIAKEKIPTAEVSAGDSIDLGDPALSVGVIFPSADFQFSKTNAPVLAFLVRYGSTAILLGGDMTKKEQAYVAGLISSSSVLEDSPNRLLILPHAENAGIADEDFFNAFNPRYIVTLKRPSEPKSARVPKPPTASKKPAKPAKPPFSVDGIPGLSVTNLYADGDTEFISDGLNFSRKKLGQ